MFILGTIHSLGKRKPLPYMCAYVSIFLFGFSLARTSLQTYFSNAIKKLGH